MKSYFLIFSSCTDPHLGHTLVTGCITMGFPVHPHFWHSYFAIRPLSDISLPGTPINIILSAIK